MQNERKPKIEFEKGKKYKIELIFDTCKSGKTSKPDGKSYNWYLYQCKYNSNEYTFFVSTDEYVEQGEINILDTLRQKFGDRIFYYKTDSLSLKGALIDLL